MLKLIFIIAATVLSLNSVLSQTIEIFEGGFILNEDTINRENYYNGTIRDWYNFLKKKSVPITKINDGNGGKRVYLKKEGIVIEVASYYYYKNSDFIDTTKVSWARIVFDKTYDFSALFHITSVKNANSEFEGKIIIDDFIFNSKTKISDVLKEFNDYITWIGQNKGCENQVHFCKYGYTVSVTHENGLILGLEFLPWTCSDKEYIMDKK